MICVYFLIFLPLVLCLLPGVPFLAFLDCVNLTHYLRTQPLCLLLEGCYCMHVRSLQQEVSHCLMCNVLQWFPTFLGLPSAPDYKPKDGWSHMGESFYISHIPRIWYPVYPSLLDEDLILPGTKDNDLVQREVITGDFTYNGDLGLALSVKTCHMPSTSSV